MNKMNNKGFTLTELLGVIVIMGFLISIAIPAYFNVGKSVKENEYQSKKQYIESLAIEYAADHGLDTTFSVSRLITNGYMSAEEYKNDIPFISNPSNEEDNLACHIISLKLEGHEYYATMLEESDCNLVIDDISSTSMGISAYEYEDNKVGNLIELESGTNSLKWTNKNVLIVFNPIDENIKEINANIFGDSKTVNMNNMLKDVKVGDTININNYSNLIEIKTDLILKENIFFNIVTEESVKKSNLEVKIDKEAPIVNIEKYDGFTAEKKDIIVYVSDGNGSKGEGVYLTQSNVNSSVKDGAYYNVSEGQEIVLINAGLENGTYYLWGKDKVGNISSTSTELNVKNVDEGDPTGTLTISSNNSNYKSRNVTIVVNAGDSGIGAVSTCITENNYSEEEAASKCSWNNFIKDSYSKSYTFSSSEGSGATHTIYAYIKDGVGNIKKYQKSYTLYKSCTNFIRVDGSTCTKACGGGTYNQLGRDKWLGSSCPQYNLSSGGSACNTMDCCSSVKYTKGTACSAVCNGGQYIGYAYSNYNGQRCANKDAYNQGACNTQDCCSSVRGAGWGGCSVSCGWGTQYQAMYSNYDGRYCRTDSQGCFPADCCSSTYSVKGSWGSCSKSCGGGKKKRTVTYYSNYNGQYCSTQTQKTDCNKKACSSGGGSSNSSTGCCWSWDGGCNSTGGECTPDQQFTGCSSGCSDDCGRC